VEVDMAEVVDAYFSQVSEYRLLGVLDALEHLEM